MNKSSSPSAPGLADPRVQAVGVCFLKAALSGSDGTTKDILQMPGLVAWGWGNQGMGCVAASGNQTASSDLNGVLRSNEMSDDSMVLPTIFNR